MLYPGIPQRLKPCKQSRHLHFRRTQMVHIYDTLNIYTLHTHQHTSNAGNSTIEKSPGEQALQGLLRNAEKERSI